MTDFLDRIVARVLPVQSREGVVRTRPRSRFEQGVVGVADLEAGGDGVESVDGAADGAAGGQRTGEGGEGATDGGARREDRAGAARSPDPMEARAPEPVLRRSARGQPPGSGVDEGDGSAPARSTRSPRAEGSHGVSGRLDDARGLDARGRGVLDSADARTTPALRREPLDPGASSRPVRGALPGNERATPPAKDRATPSGEVATPAPAPAIRLRPSADEGVAPSMQRPERRGADEGSRAPRSRDGLPLRPSAGADTHLPLPSEPTLPAIQLRIGRVEIRGDRAAPPAPRPPSPPPPRPRAPAVDLAEYLRRRDAGRRP